MITYEQIQKANEGLTSIDVKGKNYVMVNEKVKAFRRLFPEGFIHTDILSLENGVVTMKSEAGYFEDGVPRILSTGMAFERQDANFINKTSFIENCETSAVGRALSFLALGADDSICSAEELANAINNQEKKGKDKPKNFDENNPPPPSEDQSKPFTRPAKPVNSSAKVETMSQVPDMTGADYMRSKIEEVQKKKGYASYEEAKKQVVSWIDGLVKSNAIPKIDLAHITLDEAVNAFNAIDSTFMAGGKK